MKHTHSVLVENKPGALMRVTSMFARRGFNIESLAVEERKVSVPVNRCHFLPLSLRP